MSESLTRDGLAAKVVVVVVVVVVGDNLKRDALRGNVRGTRGTRARAGNGFSGNKKGLRESSLRP